MRVLILTFGKLKTVGLRETANYYQSLTKGFVKMDEIELKALSIPDKSPATRKLIQEREGLLLSEELEKHLSPRGIFYLLDEGGKSFSTQQWSQQVRDWEGGSIPEVAFCVGSSLGFSEKLRHSARGVFSFGPQTLPHELARVVLYEQLYRAWSVTRNHPYHNDGA